jgi:predicted ArsR family transcriptional regulator
MLGAQFSRVEILRSLLASRETSTAEMMAATGLTRGGIRRHLTALSAERVVSERRTTHPRGAGPISYWTVDSEDLISTLDSLIVFLESAQSAHGRGC